MYQLLRCGGINVEFCRYEIKLDNIVKSNRGINHMVDTVQCFFQLLINESNQFKAPKFIIILHVVK